MLEKGWSKRTDRLVQVTSVSTLILAADGFRKYLCFQNVGPAAITITFEGPQTAGEGIQLLPTNIWEPMFAPGGAVYAKTSGISGQMIVVEGYI